MKLIQLGNYYSAALDDSGLINFPYSHFINQKANPGTRAVELRALKVLNKYLTANNLDLSVNCLNGELLSYEQARQIRALCWLPIQSVEEMSNKVLTRIFKATSKKQIKDSNNVSRGTACQRAETISRFFNHYEMYFVPQLIHSEQLRTKIKDNLRMVTSLLRSIKSPNSSHPGQIVSLPTSKYLRAIEIVLKKPEMVFVNENGIVSRNILRDQCIFLLAVEGLRPGAISAVELGRHYQLNGYLDLSARATKSSNSPYGPRSKGSTSTLRAYSQPRLKVYPFTQKLIENYVNTERSRILRKQATNKSQGYLFITEHGQPIASSTTLKNIFSQASKSLQKLGLLDIESDPHMRTKKNGEYTYKFYAYVLRHSAATFFLAKNGLSDATLIAMRLRFGWSINSNQPHRYAERQFIDISNAALHDHMNQLTDLANSQKL